MEACHLFSVNVPMTFMNGAYLRLCKCREGGLNSQYGKICKK